MIYLVLIIQAVLEMAIIILIYTAVMFIGYFTFERLRVSYWKWKDRRFMLRCQKEYMIRLQHQLKEGLHRKEQEKYPLFYWRELINGDS